MKKMVIKTSKKKDFIELFAGLSKQRLELIWQIKRLKPSSVYELANTLQKSQPYLKKEVEFLAEKGLITLKKQKSQGRTRVKPEVIYNVLSLQMEFGHEE
jgi:predicted transcriptional regulator